MAKAVFMHKDGSGYKDLIEQQYHFPKMYFSWAEPSVGDWIVYYRPGKGKLDRVYIAIAEVDSIIADPQSTSHYFAKIKPGSYLDFDFPVPIKKDGVYANSLIQRPDGKPNGLAQAAIHPIKEDDFWGILDRGFETFEDDELPRQKEENELSAILEMNESQQAAFISTEKRRVVETTFNKKVRSRVFRRQVIRAYNKTCAFTGLRLINGGGRAEVEAAHIRPVKANGPDKVSNGLALSGTAHWMFDRGLLSLSNEGEILVSRHINNIDDTNKLLVSNKIALLPELEKDRPHPGYLDWHRKNCFKN